MQKHDPELARKLYQSGPDGQCREIAKGLRVLHGHIERMAENPALGAVDSALAQNKTVHDMLVRLRVQLAQK
jgi:hypothetical protein